MNPKLAIPTGLLLLSLACEEPVTNPSDTGDPGSTSTPGESWTQDWPPTREALVARAASFADQAVSTFGSDQIDLQNLQDGQLLASDDLATLVESAPLGGDVAALFADSGGDAVGLQIPGSWVDAPCPAAEEVLFVAWDPAFHGETQLWLTLDYMCGSTATPYGCVKTGMYAAHKNPVCNACTPHCGPHQVDRDDCGYCIAPN